jgi:hypothetical protein
LPPATRGSAAASSPSHRTDPDIDQKYFAAPEE